MALSPKAIRIFAAVEVLRDNQTDVRHALATLFEPDLAKFNGQVFNPTLLCNEINSQYRLGITADIIEGFVPIFLEKGWIEKIVTGEKSAFVVQCQSSPDITGDLDEFNTKARSIATDFRKFIGEISPLSQVMKSDEELIDDLVDWLMNLDRVTEATLKVASSSFKIGTKLHVNFEDTSDSPTVSESTFLSARFVDHLFKTKSDHVGFLVELGEVGLITEVVRDFQRPLTAVKKTDICIYLDAPLALDYLGASGAAPEASIAGILASITSLGGQIRIFRQSIEELQSALNAVLARPNSERTGPTAEALRRREVLEAYVRQIASNPDTILKSKGVGIVDQTTESFPNEHKFFTKDAIEVFYSQIAWIREDAARFHDASIAAMAFRKRMGARSSDLFEVKHIVLTRNPMFPLLARRIASEYNYIGPSHVGPVIHQRQLATAVWLRVGARQDADIPRRYVLAACRRVLTLRKNIVDKVHALKSTLSEAQAEQLELLLSEDRSAQVLMDKTLGSASIIDSFNIPILLEEMKKAQISEHIAQSKAKLDEVNAKYKARENELSKNVEMITQAYSEAQSHSDYQTKKLHSVIVNLIKSTNSKIKFRREVTIAGSLLAFIALNVLSYFGGFLKPPGFYISFAVALAIGSMFQFSAFFRGRFFNPFYWKFDHAVLRKKAAEFGLEYSEIVELVEYDGNRFKAKDVA